MKSLHLRNISVNLTSFEKLNALYMENAASSFQNINLSLEKWFSANCSSALGAILYLIKKRFNTITIDAAHNIDPVLHKNEFLTFFGENRRVDSYNTTINYKELTPNDHHYFNEYVMRELLSKNCFPQMTQELKKKIGEAIYEIFVNAQIHSESERVFTCGQHFPNKETLEFMITDIGIGIQEKVNRKFNSSLTATEAIRWAMEDSHTTKDVPGGLGLAILKEFISLNGGKLTVVSGRGFWQMDNGRVAEHILQNPFPGTSVNIYVKTDDSKSYSLTNYHTNDIF